MREDANAVAPQLDNTLSWHDRYYSADAWGMLASIDVYNCPAELLNEEYINTVLQKLCCELNAACCCESCCVKFSDPERGDGLRFTQLLDSGTVTGRCSIERKSFYCDIFMGRFFEPREISELLINQFNGSYYRLQVAMRQ